MTREHKLALVVGFGLVLFMGILIADHFAAEGRSRAKWPAAMIPHSMPEGLLQGVPLSPSDKDTPNRDRGNQDLARGNQDFAYEGPNVEFAPREPRHLMGRPPNTPSNRDLIPNTPGAIYYTVIRGDSLTRIAQKQLGNQNLWREIQSLNALPNQNITPGQKLRMPVDGSSRPLPQSRLREVEISSREYEVQPGDSLGGIAKKELGKESLWKKIQSLNSIDGTTIRPGQTLLLPTR